MGVPASHPAVAALADRLATVSWMSGLYLAGSLATGDHVPGVSDLDLVALTDGPPDTELMSSIHSDLDAGVAAGADLGCAYVAADRLGEPDASHPTWTHGRLVHRSLTTIPRVELAVHGLTVFGEDVRTAFPPVSEDDIREAARTEVCGYWATAVRHPAWWVLEPEIAELSLTAMARGRPAAGRSGRQGQRRTGPRRTEWAKVAATARVRLPLSPTHWLQRAEDVTDVRIEAQGVEHTQQFALLEAEVGLHDRCDALEVLAEVFWGGGLIYGSLQAAEEVADHGVVLLQVPDRLAQLRV
jgi:hypothetical protein